MRMQVFDNEDDYEYFLTLLKIELEKENIGLYAYCLMSTTLNFYFFAIVTYMKCYHLLYKFTKTVLASWHH
jgi:hypothetical protein